MAHGELSVNLVSGAASILELGGRLEAKDVAGAQDKFAEAVTAGAPIVIDLAKLTYLSSVGLRLILKTMKQAQASRLPFVIAGAKGPVREILN